MKVDSLETLLASSHVLRCHTMPCLNRPTVGHHTFRTLIILHWLYWPEYPPATVNYMMLIHDTAEIFTGDMPGHTKADYAEVGHMFNRLEIEFEKEHGLGISIGDKPLTDVEQAVISLCDRADLTFYACDEIEMGNNKMRPMAERAHIMAGEQFNIILKLSPTEADIGLPRLRTLMYEMYIRTKRINL